MQQKLIQELGEDPSTSILAALATRALLFEDAYAADEYLFGCYRITTYLKGEYEDGLKPNEAEASLLACLILLARTINKRFSEPETKGAQGADVTPTAEVSK